MSQRDEDQTTHHPEEQIQQQGRAVRSSGDHRPEEQKQPGRADQYGGARQHSEGVRQAGQWQGAPDQYGQDHTRREQFGPGSGRQEWRSESGWSGVANDPYTAGRYRDRSRREGYGRSVQYREDARHGRTGDFRGQPFDPRRSGPTDHPFRDERPFSQQTSGHAPFGHSAFGESHEPHFFGTGTQGHGGGPSFTGGTFGTADDHSDAPYFEDAGFNQGFYPDSSARFGENQWGDTNWSRQVQGRGDPGRGSPYAIGSAQRSQPSTPSGRMQHEQRRYPPGPKGYQRSDERMREDISERLMEAYHIDSSQVTVQVQGGKVILEGTVPDRYMKHSIEDLADAAPGVQDVENRIRVDDPRRRSDTGASS